MKKFLALFISLWLFVACRTGELPPTSSSSTGNPDPASAADETPITLAYNPADDSLLKAQDDGLFRWRDGDGWESISLPQAAKLTGVIVNPEEPATIYVSGTGLGILRSDDGGTNWRVINTGLPGLEVTALALHSFQRETLFAWLQNAGIYRTEDGGTKWVRVPDQGPPDKEVRGLTHSTLPGSMNTGWLYASTPSGAYLSMDCF